MHQPAEKLLTQLAKLLRSVIELFSNMIETSTYNVTLKDKQALKEENYRQKVRKDDENIEGKLCHLSKMNYVTFILTRYL